MTAAAIAALSLLGGIRPGDGADVPFAARASAICNNFGRPALDTPEMDVIALGAWLCCRSLAFDEGGRKADGTTGTSTGFGTSTVLEGCSAGFACTGAGARTGEDCGNGA
jgi:hypothetical protein